MVGAAALEGGCDHVPLVNDVGEEEKSKKSEHPSRKRSFAQSLVNNVRIVRRDFEPKPYHEGFFTRPSVVVFIFLYAIAGLVVPVRITRNHYLEAFEAGEAPAGLFVEDSHKQRIAIAYLCMVPLTFFAVPVFTPSLATASVMPYLIILVFGVKSALEEALKEEYQVFVCRMLGHLVATMIAFSWLKILDYLDHIMHEIMLLEEELLHEKPIQKMRTIMHSVGVTRTGDESKDRFMAVHSTSSLASVIYEKVWCTVLIGSKIFALVAYAVFTLVDEKSGALICAGVVWYGFMTAFMSYKFWDQASVLIKLWMNKPFFVGDLVSINSLDGFVEHITMAYVIIRTFDCKQTYFPLTDLAGAIIQNWSRRPTKPMLMYFSAVPSCSAESVEALVKFARDWINQSPQVLQTGYKKCCLNSLGHGYGIKVAFSPAIGVHKNKLQEAFVLAVAKQAHELKVQLSSQDAMSVYLPDASALQKLD